MPFTPIHMFKQKHSFETNTLHHFAVIFQYPRISQGPIDEDGLGEDFNLNENWSRTGAGGCERVF